MIPKIIHYVWLGGKKPEAVSDLIESWKQLCPDYTFMEWNDRNIPLVDCDFLNEALYLKKYAFASDVIRMYALLYYGGIYLDTDVRLIKSFDAFLDNKSFIGFETPFYVSTAVIGAEASTSWVGEFLQMMYQTRGKHFITKDGSLDLIPNTQKLTEFFNCSWHRNSHDIKIYPVDYFCCKSFYTGEIKTSENSVAIHDFACTWRQNKKLNVFQKINNLVIRYKLRLRRHG